MTVISRLIPTTAVRTPGYKSCLTIPSTGCFHYESGFLLGWLCLAWAIVLVGVWLSLETRLSVPIFLQSCKTKSGRISLGSWLDQVCKTNWTAICTCIVQCGTFFSRPLPPPLLSWLQYVFSAEEHYPHRARPPPQCLYQKLER